MRSLQHALPDVAADIHRVMIAAYAVEAGLLGVADFFPLRRTAAQVAGAGSAFIGAFVRERLAAVVEIERDRAVTNIATLVVDPAHFRTGLGKALVRHVIERHGGGDITVSTGVANDPALRLYRALGFQVQRRWMTECGIPMVTLIRLPGASAAGSALLQLPPDDRCRMRTARLDLESMLRSHAEAMFSILADPALYTFTGGSPPESMDALAERYAQLESRRSPDGAELWLNWLISERREGAAVGYVQASICAAHSSIAWVVGTSWQGRGYATEAASALIAWLGEIGASPVRACVHPEHTASQRVAHHAGLCRTGEVIDGEEVWAQSSFILERR